jgi:hypothetical protein
LGGEEVQLLILYFGTRWGWVVSVTPRPRFTPGERTPGTHFTGGWVGPRAGLQTEARGNILCPCRGLNLDRPVVQSVARHYTDWATPAPNSHYIGLKNLVMSPRRGSTPRLDWLTVSRNVTLTLTDSEPVWTQRLEEESFRLCRGSSLDRPVV